MIRELRKADINIVADIWLDTNIPAISFYQREGFEIQYSGLDEATVDEMYYEPPLMQVIPSACNACEDNVYEVSNLCRGCLAHSCMEVCPRDAITHVDGQAHIDKSKCIKCGKCKSACPYDAIGKKVRPCSVACGVKAIESDEYGRAVINQDKCLSCPGQSGFSQEPLGMFYHGIP